MSPSVGSQLPRIQSFPASPSNATGEDAIELAASAGLFLDPWQQHVIRNSLGERTDGAWAASEVALILPRQNGKGSLLECRELAGLFLLDEQLILHSAHEFKTAAEGFRRIMFLIESSPDLDSQVKKVTRSHGDEGVELRTGQRLRFVARSGGSGRGFSGDCVIFDEAYALDSKHMDALMPTLSARDNVQLWYASSAGMLASEVLAGIRRRGVAEATGLAYFEWSAHETADLDDQDAWLAANPAVGYRITMDAIARERAALSDEGFARERLGIWAEAGASAFPFGTWAETTDPKSEATAQVAFSVDVKPDRSFGSISVEGLREDGLIHSELVDRRAGTDWIVDRIAELDLKWSPVGVGIDEGGPAGSLIGDIERAGVAVTRLTMRQVGQAAAQFYDAVVHGHLRHRSQPLMDAAVASAVKRPLGDAWAWGRKGGIDVDPLVSASNALFVLNQHLDGGGLSPDDVYVGKF